MPPNNNGHDDDNGNSRRRGKKGGVTSDRPRMLQVLLSTYLHEGIPSCRPIRVVARELGISAQQVTAFLQRAHKEGFFTPLVHLPYELAQATALEVAVKHLY